MMLRYTASGEIAERVINLHFPCIVVQVGINDETIDTNDDDDEEDDEKEDNWRRWIAEEQQAWM